MPLHRMRGENGDATLTAAMLRVAIAQGAAVPHALIVVGGTLGGRDGDRLAAAGHALERGVRWRDAWRASAVGVPASGPSPAGDGRRTSSPGHRRSAPPAAADASDAADPLTTIGDALESSWTHGDSPVGRLSAAIEQIERETTADIERKAGALTVRLLVPTGLCFLPAFILIGVVPAIASFAW